MKGEVGDEARVVEIWRITFGGNVSEVWNFLNEKIV